MTTVMTPEIRELIEAVHYRPAVSIIMPFEPKMTPKRTLAEALERAVEKVGVELRQKYFDEMGELVSLKIGELDTKTGLQFL